MCVLEGLKNVEELRLNKCIYIEDACLERLSQIQTLQNSVRNMSIVSCGNVTDKGLLALHHLRYDNCTCHYISLKRHVHCLHHSKPK